MLEWKFEAMTHYHSPFEHVTLDELEKHQYFRGSLYELLYDLQHNPRAVQRIYHPQRIIKLIIDYKTSHPEIPHLEDLLEKAIPLALYVYKNEIPDELISHFKAAISNFKLEALYKEVIVQQLDKAACYSYIPEFSQHTSQRLVKNCDGKDILFIPIANGALPAGIDVFLRYCEMTGSTHSILYPCRFSHYKNGDTIPKLTDSEIDFLRKTSEDKKVIVFEENVATGETLRKFTGYLKTILDADKIIEETNVNIARYLRLDRYHKESHSQLINAFMLEIENEKKFTS